MGPINANPPQAPNPTLLGSWWHSRLHRIPSPSKRIKRRSSHDAFKWVAMICTYTCIQRSHIWTIGWKNICYDLWWWWWWWWWWWRWSFYNLFVAPTYGLRDGVLTMSSNSKKLVQQHHLVSNLKFALHEGIQNWIPRTLTELPSGSMFVECSAFRLSCSATRIPGSKGS